MWTLIGHVKYGFGSEELKAVTKNLARIGLFPRGYMYPELHREKVLPAPLAKVLQRKLE